MNAPRKPSWPAISVTTFWRMSVVIKTLINNAGASLLVFLIAAAISFSINRENYTSTPITAAMSATAGSKPAGQFKYDASTIIDGQPDGSEIHLKDYSTEELTLQTTLDDYTVVRSHNDGFYYYARLSENGS